jgi:hypothetical protein
MVIYVKKLTKAPNSIPDTDTSSTSDLLGHMPKERSGLHSSLDLLRK